MTFNPGRVCSPVFVRGASIALACGLVSGLAAPALAGVPSVMDVIPKDAAAVIAIDSLEGLTNKLEMTAGKLPSIQPREGDEALPPNPIMQGLLQLRLVSNFPGINKAGSLGLYVPAGATATKENPSPPVVALIPVADYKGLVTTLGGSVNTPITTLSLGGQTFTVRDAGGGYMVASQQGTLVEAFTSVSGSMAAHQESLGAEGERLASGDVLILGDMKAIGPVLMDAFQAYKLEALMTTPLGMIPNATEGLDQLLGSFLEQSKTGIAALTLGETAIAIDLASTFQPESPLSKFFAAPGNSGSLAASLPNRPYIITAIADMSNPGMRGLLGQFVGGDEPRAAGEPASVFGNLMRAVAQSQGAAFQLGMPAGGLSAGLLSSSLLYLSGDKAGQQLDAVRDAIVSLDGTTAQNARISASWLPATIDAPGARVDAWSIVPTQDPNKPADMVTQITQSVLFGTPPASDGHPTGFGVATDKGMLLTFSKSSKLVTSALEAAKTEGLRGDESFRNVADQLPPGRWFEVYFGTKQVLQTMQMMPLAAGSRRAPKLADKIDPVALVGGARGGSSFIQLRMPHNALDAVLATLQPRPAPAPAPKPKPASKGPQ
ncbi:MAG: hypothetical protein SFZ23_05660 [Planctomycetota bacterium]|nr:hypothetical protein [Planctomycetota bacterium]